MKSKPNPPKSKHHFHEPNRILIGTFPLGHEKVELYGLPKATSGSFSFCPKGTSPGCIEIGLNHPHWRDAITVMLLEAFEYSFARHSNLFQQSQSISGDYTNYSLFLTHGQFSQHCANVSRFLTLSLPEVVTLYNMIHGY